MASMWITSREAHADSFTSQYYPINLRLYRLVDEADRKREPSTSPHRAESMPSANPHTGVCTVR